MHLGVAMTNYDHYFAVFRTEVLRSGVHTLVLDSVKVEVFREERTYRVSEYMPSVIPAITDLEACIPARDPLTLPSNFQHIVLTTRTKAGRTGGQKDCEAALDEAISVLSAISSPDLFRIQVFRGWLQNSTMPGFGCHLRFVDPVSWAEKKIASDYRGAKAAISRNSALSDRFSLMARFIAKGLAETPGEEAFVWLWTALEVFPMVGTTDIRPISEFISGYVGLPAESVKNKLKIGWLFGMRSQLIHYGKLPLTEADAFSALGTLELVVRAVMRHSAGMPYDGELDQLLA